MFLSIRCVDLWSWPWIVKWHALHQPFIWYRSTGLAIMYFGERLIKHGFLSVILVILVYYMQSTDLFSSALWSESGKCSPNKLDPNLISSSLH